VHRAPGVSCALCYRGAKNSCTPRAHRAARMQIGVSTSLPATNVKRLRKGALATKQSSFAARRKGKDGLLRGACHRARIRATRWLAMAVFVNAPRTLSRHHPRRRVIQYSGTSAMESRGRGVLDTPHARGMTVVGDATGLAILMERKADCWMGWRLARPRSAN
jgi:hypothetical protein